MKKFLITSFLVVATVIGAGAQITFEPTGRNDFVNLTFSNATTSLPSPYTQARLLFGVTGFTFPPAGGFDPAGQLAFAIMTLSGDGLTNGTPMPNLNVTANMSDPSNYGQYTIGTAVPLTGPLNTWNSANSIVNFSTLTQNNAFASPGARIYYAVQYGSSDFGQLNTTGGNITLTAVPEPSTYVAAAGLLGLCLWSARRQLFKLAGLRCTPPSSGSNGAA